MGQQFYQQLLKDTEQERNYLLSSPIIKQCMQGDISLQQYVEFLTEAYHHVKHTVPLFMACGSRLSGKYEWLREAIAEYIEEEIGHQEWILNDLESCGALKHTIRKSNPGLHTELMVSYAYDTVMRKNPVGLFGMVNVLEGTSVALATQAAVSIKQSLGLPDTAFSYLTSHGSLDEKHIDFYRTLVNRLDDASDREAVVHCAKVVYVLYANMIRSLTQEDVMGSLREKVA